MTKRRDVDEGMKHAIESATYTLRPEYNRHVPCLYCACGQGFFHATWEGAGAYYDSHLKGEEPTGPLVLGTTKVQEKRRKRS